MRFQFRYLPHWLLLAVIGLAILILPFLLRTSRFRSKLLSNQEKWVRLEPSEYEMVVESNSMNDCTGGWNTILVRGGEIVEAKNSKNGNCSHESFRQLTVEGLFTRIWNECIRNRAFSMPFPVCNVEYDEELGFPRRVDTYTFNKQGEYLPSVTVESVTRNP